MIDWWRLEQRQPPGPQDIKKAVKAALKLPDDGDGDHVISPFDFYQQPIPPATHEDWAKATQRPAKIGKLKGTTARLVRSNLVWHLEHPGQSRYRGQFNTHIQVMKTKAGDKVIIDGHHRAAALLMLGVKKDMTWTLKEKDMG